MTVVPRNPEKGTENVIRARTGSETRTVAGRGRGTGTGIRTAKEVKKTGIVIATTGIDVSAARKGNTVIVPTIVTATVMIVTVTGAMIPKGEETETEMATVGIGPAPAPRLRAVTVNADLDLVRALVQRASV